MPSECSVIIEDGGYGAAMVDRYIVPNLGKRDGWVT